MCGCRNCKWPLKLQCVRTISNSLTSRCGHPAKPVPASFPQHPVPGESRESTAGFRTRRSYHGYSVVASVSRRCSHESWQLLVRRCNKHSQGSQARGQSCFTFTSSCLVAQRLPEVHSNCLRARRCTCQKNSFRLHAFKIAFFGGPTLPKFTPPELLLFQSDRSIENQSFLSPTFSQQCSVI